MDRVRSIDSPIGRFCGDSARAWWRSFKVTSSKDWKVLSLIPILVGRCSGRGFVSIFDLIHSSRARKVY